ncbi:hypothetical protein ACFLZX_03750 [Nanoarchaeota archaeon]
MEEENKPEVTEHEHHKEHHAHTEQPTHHHKQDKSKTLQIVLLCVVIFILLMQLFLTSDLKDRIRDGNLKNVTAQKEIIEQLESKEEINIILIENEDCKECTKFDEAIDMMKQSGVAIDKINKYEFDSEDGKKIIEKYYIEIIPTIILSEGIKNHQEIIGVWDEIGSIEDDGNYILRAVAPPFVNLTSDKKEGIVTVTYIDDLNCEECFEVDLLRKSIKEGFLIYIGEELTLDIKSDEAEELIEKYEIENIPTFILSKEAMVYKSITEIWDDVGSIEDDGSLVLRELLIFQAPYKNLKTDQIAQPPQIEE